MALNIVWGKQNDLVTFSRITPWIPMVELLQLITLIRFSEQIDNASFDWHEKLSANKIRIKFRNILNFMKTGVFVIRVFTVCAFFRFL